MEKPIIDVTYNIHFRVSLTEVKKTITTPNQHRFTLVFAYIVQFGTIKKMTTAIDVIR